LLLVRAFLTAKPTAQILRKKSRRNSSRPRFCRRVVQKHHGGGFYGSFQGGGVYSKEKESVGKSERRAKGGVGKKCVKIRQRRFRLMFALMKFGGIRKILQMTEMAFE